MVIFKQKIIKILLHVRGSYPRGYQKGSGLDRPTILFHLYLSLFLFIFILFPWEVYR